MTPAELAQVLTDLALDLRWTWSHAGDALWRMLGPSAWEQTRNPWVVLQDAPATRFAQVQEDAAFMAELERLVAERTQYRQDVGWCGRVYDAATLPLVAYFSLEVGLGEGLPLYAGGLGVLAGDYLKAASDLGVPVVGVSLLYQRGYFRQVLDASGQQRESYPYNDTTGLPIQPVRTPEGGWLHIPLAFPGRTLLLRVWQARVGRVWLYLLDSNDPLNSPEDRDITSELYGGGVEVRLMQEIVLGIGGWRALEALGLAVDVCHLNEGHGAFVVLERLRRCMAQQQVPFWDALWATRAGNVFTTHTPVAAGFDTFAPALIDKYFPLVCSYLSEVGLTLPELLALGRRHPHDAQEPFHMAYLALRGCARANGVSQLHGAVSRQIFQPLYPRWPTAEVPIGHVTNGVHVPTWDSAWADALWTTACGKARWGGTAAALSEAINGLSDEELWGCRSAERRDLVRYARQRLARQLGQHGAAPEVVAQAAQVLDPNALTLGFARRFTAYKRPNLLLHDPPRLLRLLTSAERPVQLLMAGKAHPADHEGKRLIQAWAQFVQQPAVRGRVVFLEDYDMALAQELVQGVDVWINTPRRPWEACGTSGMKVLVNGGLNLSVLDGWWAEAYTPEVGWALGHGQEHTEAAWDALEAEQLYTLFEQQIVPEFFDRDARGIPVRWVQRIRTSMAHLAPRFSSNRMVQQYLEDYYQPAAASFRRRAAEGGALAHALHAWHTTLAMHWHEVHFGSLDCCQDGEAWLVRVHVYLGELTPEQVRVELYAESLADAAPACLPMAQAEPIPGAVHGYVYQARVPTTRPSTDWTPRVVPYHPDACVPMEAAWITWQR